MLSDPSMYSQPFISRGIQLSPCNIIPLVSKCKYFFSFSNMRLVIKYIFHAVLKAISKWKHMKTEKKDGKT